MLLVGNKIDLVETREVKREEGAAFAQDNNIAFIETSAMNASNVDLAFERIISGKFVYKEFIWL